MKIGFIGCGNMATAMISGMLEKKIVQAKDILGTDVYKPSLEKAKETLNIEITDSNIDLAKNVDVIFLSVKPQFYEDTINEIKDSVNEKQIIVTIAPGKTLEWLKDTFEKDIKIIRTMPNTPAMVSEGMSAMCPNEFVKEADLNYITALFEGFGEVEVVSEKIMDVVTGISGSGPAYIFMIIEALADGAVTEGMPRAQAYKFASQTVLGSAKMVLETGKHPGELKDMVMSPGGTTAEAICRLEEKGLRSAIIDGLRTCVKKSKSL